MSGTIVELLAKEEDTVTVGADLFRIEPGEGGAAAAGKQIDFLSSRRRNNLSRIYLYVRTQLLQSRNRNRRRRSRGRGRRRQR